MAVYKIEKGELVKVADEIETLVRDDWAEWENFEDEFLGSRLRFYLYDHAEDVYRLYRREDTDRPKGELPGVRYVFDVNLDDSNIDYILLTDALPDFLAVMRMLEPLAARKVRLDAEFEKQRTQRR